MRVAVLAGGLSLERVVSLESGRRVAEALERRGHEVTRLDVDENLVSRLLDGRFDVAYLALHGKAGEDGTVQGLLELIGVPYTGPDAVASALAWDKAVVKGHWQRSGLATPAWIAVSADAVRDFGAAKVLPQVVQRLGLPLVVKPTQGGASLGVGIVTSPAELPSALRAAYRYHSVALIEAFVEGTEVALSIIDGEALPAVEVVARNDHYDFAARYTPGAAELHAPARLPAATLERVASDALAAYDLAGCRHVTRVDMIVDAAGQPQLLELDTCPGMTDTSLLPMAAEAAGWDFTQLCGRILDLAATVSAAVRAAAPLDAGSSQPLHSAK